MIIVNIKNGLGNQMFQYAFGKVLEWKYSCPVYFDLMRNNISQPLKCDLDIFNIETIHEADISVINTFKPFSIRRYRDNNQYLYYIYFKLRKKFQSNKLITESHPSIFIPTFNKIKLNTNYYFLGHWMNFDYYKAYIDRLRDLYTLKDDTFYNTGKALEIISSQYQTVSIHIRRGDYLTCGFMANLSLDYYTQAINKIANKIPNIYIYLFTDDPKWARENFKTNFPYEIVEANQGNNCYKDIVLMSLCRHNIIANSSFSWWSAFLNKNPNALIIAPKNWYNYPTQNRYVNNMIPHTWFRI